MLNNEETLKSLEQQIEDAQNRVFNIDQGYARVKRLHDSEILAITELQGIKSTIEQNVKELTMVKTTLEKEVSSLQSEKDSLTVDNEQSRKHFVEVNADIDKKSLEHSERETVVMAKESAVEVREQKVAQRENNAEVREIEAEDKHSKIKDFISKL